MEFSAKSETIIVDYITLTRREFEELNYNLISIAKRESPQDVLEFLGYEQGYRPTKITVESDKFIWEFNIKVD